MIILFFQKGSVWRVGVDCLVRDKQTKARLRPIYQTSYIRENPAAKSNHFKLSSSWFPSLFRFPNVAHSVLISAAQNNVQVSFFLAPHLSAKEIMADQMSRISQNFRTAKPFLDRKRPPDAVYHCHHFPHKSVISFFHLFYLAYRKIEFSSKLYVLKFRFKSIVTVITTSVWFCFFYFVVKTIERSFKSRVFNLGFRLI